MSGVAFFVAGTPIQQGSKRGFSRKGSTFVQIVDDNKDKLKPWRAEVTRIAAASWLDRPRFEDAVRVTAVFVLPRGKTVKREYPTVTPDLDKLVRALLDGIGDAKCIWGDDKQVTQIVTEKVYGAAPGVHVVISRADAPLIESKERAA